MLEAAHQEPREPASARLPWRQVPPRRIHVCQGTGWRVECPALPGAAAETPAACTAPARVMTPRGPGSEWPSLGPPCLRRAEGSCSAALLSGLPKAQHPDTESKAPTFPSARPVFPVVLTTSWQRLAGPVGGGDRPRPCPPSPEALPTGRPRSWVAGRPPEPPQPQHGPRDTPDPARPRCPALWWAPGL